MAWPAVAQRGLVAAPLLLLILSPFAPGASAQPPDDFYDFSLTFIEPREQYEVEAVGGTGQLDVLLLFRDLSFNFPGVPATGDVVDINNVEVRAEIVSEAARGWQVQYTPTSFQSSRGDEETIRLRAIITTATENPFMQARLNVTLSPYLRPEIVEERSVIVNFFTRGVPGFDAVPSGSSDSLSPSQIGHATIDLTNAATLPRAFGFEVQENPCGMFIVPPPHTVLGPRETRPIRLTFEAPENQFWYYAEQCPLRLGVFALDNPDYVQSVSVNTVVDGFWVDPEQAFMVVAAAVALLLVFLFLKRRKERLEEEILGKPQKPWLIPVEQVYLKHLRKRDERAWYMVRHHLMAEEYQSALLWYKHYKQATRGQRTRERLVLRHERAYERWKERWARKIEKPLREADRYEAKLQRGLDREAKARLRRERRKHKSLVAKMRQAHEKKVARAEERHAKAAKKAQKKGLAPPPAPVIDEPDYPPEPTLQRVLLADHKLHKKAERARRKALRKRGDLEVKFEKKDARRLHRIQRKVQRIARKIDDPDFIAEHPLLSDRS